VSVYNCTLCLTLLAVRFEVKRSCVWGDDVSPSVTYFQRLNPLCRFHEMRCKSSARRVVERGNRRSDSGTEGHEGIYTSTFRLSWPIWVKFGINDLHTMLGFVSMGRGRPRAVKVYDILKVKRVMVRCVCRGAFGPARRGTKGRWDQLKLPCLCVK